nr:zinc ribbon domain-containing protein [Xenococcaceae cyanobacterium MO_207.B15]
EGKIYLEVDRFFPSSKTCHVCLNQVGSLPLDVRTWTCSVCNTTHNRDLNAAISLRDEGLRLLTVGYDGAYKFRSKATETAPPESNSACRTTVATCGTRDKAYCPDVRPSRGGRKKSTTRQSVG